MVNANRKGNKMSLKSITFSFISFLSLLLICLYLFNFENFYYFQFGDRDLLRSSVLLNDFVLAECLICLVAHVPWRTGNRVSAGVR